MIVEHNLEWRQLSDLKETTGYAYVDRERKERVSFSERTEVSRKWHVA